MPVINYEMLYENRKLYNAKKDDKLSFYMDDSGYVRAGETGETALEGLYVAGDAAPGKNR